MEVGRESILERTSKLLTRDDGKKFLKTDRLDWIKQILKESEYEIMKETSLSVIYKKKNVDGRR